MIKQIKSMGRCLSIALMGLLTLGACDKSEPVKPVNEINNKLHESPSKVVYTLQEAELAEGTTLGYQSLAQIRLGAHTQRIVWEQKSDVSWGYAEDSAQEFVIKTQATSPRTVYKLDITYYSPGGQVMNEQFILNGQDKIHQHFFSYYENGRIVSEAERIPYSYVYADKTADKYTGQENPLGFEGFISFPKAIGSLSIKAELLHAYRSKLLEGGRLSPYYAPERKLKSMSDMDISVALKFREEGSPADDAPSAGDKEEDRPAQEDETPDMSSTILAGTNTSAVRKIKLELLEGHMHGPEFHYTPGPSEIKNKNLSIEQVMTIEWREGRWEITSADVKRLLMMQAKVYETGALGMPVYGLFTSFYDAQGRQITGEFAGSNYQIFYRPEHIASFSTGGKVSDQPASLFSYAYKDTRLWHESAHSGRTQYVGDTDPFGHKGYFVFHKGDRQFMLDLQLWSTPQGKRAAGAALSPAHTPSEHILKTGSKVLSVQIPCYTWLDRDQASNLETGMTLESLPQAQQPIVQALLKLLGIDMDALGEDMDLRLTAEVDETAGRWF